MFEIIAFLALAISVYNLLEIETIEKTSKCTLRILAKYLEDQELKIELLQREVNKCLKVEPTKKDNKCN